MRAADCVQSSSIYSATSIADPFCSALPARSLLLLMGFCHDLRSFLEAQEYA